MADPTFELGSDTRGRCSSGEASDSSPDAEWTLVEHYAVPPAPEPSPPWLSATAPARITFRDPGTGDAEVNPPWLEAAAQAGVVFYDPDGRAIEVPASKVPAFTAGLERVRDFEKSLEDSGASAASEPQEEEETSREEPPECQSSVCAPPVAAPENTNVPEPVPGDDSQLERRAGDSPSTRRQESDERQDLKCLVQKRYFALLREGLEPNEAAARAIVEAANLRKEAPSVSSSESDAARERVEGPAAQTNSKGSQQRCALSVKDGRQEGQRKTSKEITVVA